MHLKISKPFKDKNYNLEVATVECPYCEKSAVYRWLDNIPNTNRCKHCKKEFFFGYTFMEDDDEAFHYMKCIDCGQVHCKGDNLSMDKCGCKESIQVYVDNSDGNIKGVFVKEGDVYEEYEHEPEDEVEHEMTDEDWDSNYQDELSDKWHQNLKDSEMEVFDLFTKIVSEIKRQQAITPKLEHLYRESSNLIEKINEL